MDQSKVKELFSYNEESGRLIWKSRPKWSRVKIGSDVGSLSSCGYSHVYLGGKTYLTHRIIWLYVYGRWPVNEIDHRNGDKLDNRLANLREATINQNKQNRRISRRNKTGFKGVYIAPYGKYRAAIEIMIDGRRKTIHLGSHNTPESAHAAYQMAAQKYHGEFARLS